MISQNQFATFATLAMSPSPISMPPTISCGVPEVMSISLTTPALATWAVTADPSEALALTVSL